MERAITECIREGILEEFLRKYRAEVKSVSIYEYDEERHMRQVLEEGREEGRRESEERMSRLILAFDKSGRLAESVRAVSDPEYLHKLFREFGFSKATFWHRKINTIRIEEFFTTPGFPDIINSENPFLNTKRKAGKKMRNLDTNVKRIRRRVFKEIAKAGFESEPETLVADIEAIPYKIVQEKATYRESIYRERAVASERVRLAMGMSLRPEDAAVHITAGLEASNIDEKYYEPPLMQVIPSACDACEEKMYEVSNMCRGCVAHPCKEICPRGAIRIIKGKAVIDQERCVKCGKCKSVCPYDAIAKKERPCARACGVNAIESDNLGRAHINNDKCVSCGMCMVSCPFGAISDKSQIFQLAHALKEGKQIVAEVAPAFVSQFGRRLPPESLGTL